jgi:hypothetical protein
VAPVNCKYPSSTSPAYRSSSIANICVSGLAWLFNLEQFLSGTVWFNWRQFRMPESLYPFRTLDVCNCSQEIRTCLEGRLPCPFYVRIAEATLFAGRSGEECSNHPY